MPTCSLREERGSEGIKLLRTCSPAIQPLSVIGHLFSESYEASTGYLPVFESIQNSRLENNFHYLPNSPAEILRSDFSRYSSIF